MAKLLHCVGILAAFSQGVLAIADLTMDTRCGQTIHMSSHTQVRLRLSRFDYKDGMECKVNFHTAFGYRFLVHFESMNIEYKSPDCGYDYLAIYNGSSDTSPTVTFITRLCGTKATYDHASSGPDLTFYFQSDESITMSGFVVIITPFRTGECNHLLLNEYTCDNGRCIDDNLSCTDYDPCGDGSDCPGRSPARTTTTATTDHYYSYCDYYDCSMHHVSVSILVACVVGGVSFLIIVIVVFILCRRRRTIVQRNHVMGVATIQLPMTTNSPYDPPPPYAQVAHLPNQQSLQQCYQAPPPYTATVMGMDRSTPINDPPAARVVLPDCAASHDPPAARVVLPDCAAFQSPVPAFSHVDIPQDPKP